jgi:hypothetical protein
MDFNSPIYINTASGGTLNLNDIGSSELTTSLGMRSGYKVLAASVGESNAVGYVDKRAVDDGIDIGDSYLSGRQIAMVIGVFGSSLGDFHSKLQTLSNVMRINPRYYDSSYGFRNLTFSQATIDTSTYSTGLAPLRMIVRPMGIPEVSYDSTHSINPNIGTARGFSGRVRLNFLAKEPYRYRQTQREISISVASVSSTSTSTSLPNVGSVPVTPIVEIIHPSSTTAAVTISSVKIVLDSKTVVLNSLDFGAKDTNNETRWFVDFDSHGVYRGVRSTDGGPYVQTLRQDVIDTVYYRFGIITPADDGTSTIEFAWSGSYKPGSVTAKYYEAYY